MQTVFYIHIYFGSISLQSLYVVPLLLNDRVPTFRKICCSIYGTTFVQSSEGSDKHCRNIFQGGKMVSMHGLFELVELVEVWWTHAWTVWRVR
jgi:hypothetical protein